MHHYVFDYVVFLNELLRQQSYLHVLICESLFGVVAEILDLLV